MKTPLLDQLRATRELQEEEIKAPVVEKLNGLTGAYDKLWKEKNRIAKIATSGFGKAILNEFVHRFSKIIIDEFMKAISSSGDDAFYIPVSKNMLRMMTPETFERHCLMFYAQHMDEKADLGVSDSSVTMENKCEILYIHIPKLDVHKIVAMNE